MMQNVGQISVSSGQIDAMADRISAKEDVDELAQDFEALFVSMMLKTMRESMSEDMFAGDSSDTYGGLFDSFMGQHIAENGGIGLSSLLQPPQSPANLAQLQGEQKEPPEVAAIGPASGQLNAYRTAVATGENDQ